ncbi:unnamed protein product [Symbiodinium natans]|uniref:Uncharacterized protein n=1 Tax=Symbiodinium natans TaxID=878477 RepID=A0A812P6D6_9DINO|nr:unnamed protein product [Symbiodinium natans]
MAAIYGIYGLLQVAEQLRGDRLVWVPFPLVHRAGGQGQGCVECQALAVTLKLGMKSRIWEQISDLEVLESCSQPHARLLAKQHRQCGPWAPSPSYQLQLRACVACRL